jgi:hygromycin-B 7''-O-kinase
MDPPTPPNLFEQLESLDGYRRYFFDPAAWTPYVRQVCRRHALGSGLTIRIGLAGSFPTFIVDDRWVIKFFGRLFEGWVSFEVERFFGKLVSAYAIPAPAVIGQGELLPSGTDWPWPYLIFQFVPGISIGEVFDQVTFEDTLETARFIGKLARKLHTIPIPDTTISQPTWNSYSEFLKNQRGGCVAAFKATDSFPDHLADQLDGFLLPIDALVDAQAVPHLIHSDLTADHVLGRLENGRWTASALIDFGDGMIGNLYYELVALHLDMFRGDKRLLRVFLDTYGVEDAVLKDLPLKAMNLTLLHRFSPGLLLSVRERWPEAFQVSTLSELAHIIWDVDQPGLEIFKKA